MQPSKMRLISIGIAAENKKPSSHMLEVTPIEQVPYIDGEITADFTTIESEGIDKDGNKYSAKALVGNTLPCKWLPMGSNRITPPDVRRGEIIFIYQYADANKFYWRSAGLRDYLRRLETVVYAFSATKDESVKKLDMTNSYSVEVSTHSKLITLHTSKANGEPYAYTFQFNCDKGGVTLTDDIGNFLELNSREHRWRIKNTEGSYLEIDKNTMYQYAKDSITQETKSHVIKCDTQETTADTSITTKTATHDLTASTSLSVTSPTSTFSALVTISGLTTLKAGLAAVGGPGATFNIPIVSTMPITTAMDVIAAGKSLVLHTHISSIPGAPTSPPL